MHAMPTHADPTLAPLQAPSPSSSLETATFALG
jgi:hypothetical protein